MSVEYYISRGDRQDGPYDINEIRHLGLPGNCRVLSSVSNRWMPAANYPEIAAYCRQAQEQPQPAASFNIYSATYYYKDNAGDTYGPLTISDLAIIEIDDSALLSCDNMRTWVLAKDINGLMDVISDLIPEGSKEPEQPSTDEAELKDVIEDQERELLRREQEIAAIKAEMEAQRKQMEQERNEREKANAQKVKKLHAEEIERAISRIKSDIGNYNAQGKFNPEAYSDIHNKISELLCDLARHGDDEDFSYQQEQALLSSLRHLLTLEREIINPAETGSYAFEPTRSRIFNDITGQPADKEHTGMVVTDRNTCDYSLFGETLSVDRHDILDMLDTSHLYLRYNHDTSAQAQSFINTILGRLLLSNAPGKVTVNMVDAVDMEGTSASLKSLTRIYKVYSQPGDIHKMLEAELHHIQNVIHNLLVYPISTLHEYNREKNATEPYHVIILKGFPIGLGDGEVAMVQHIMKNGPRAGVFVFIANNEDELMRSVKAQNIMHALDMTRITDLSHTFDFADCRYPATISEPGVIQHISFPIFNERQMSSIVSYLNKQLAHKAPEVVHFSSYLPPMSQWWKEDSASEITIPFGVDSEKALATVSITQESGENSAVVIGVPGSGKSVFLHSLICNTAVKYSPDEVALYLIDFSGVEFNTYAINNLPHAKVIAPEAEREFGLSVLRELKEEGARRMALCRDNGVSNIVDLRQAQPDMKVPRLLVIIDEFQKLFEIETDAISREAMSITHIIIKEFRKFGINLILATQKLADISSGILPKDLIANRIAFKCSPADVGLIGLNTVPQLATGECIYNSQLGVASANRKIKSFYIKKDEITALLKSIHEKAAAAGIPPRDTLIFRNNDLPQFKAPAGIEREDMPADVNIFFGEPLTISPVDVSATLSRRSADNILIIGGEPDVAQGIAINAAYSIYAAHNDKSATIVLLNFMRPNDPQQRLPGMLYSPEVFDMLNCSRTEDVMEALTTVKTELDARIDDDTRSQSYIYLSVYALELAQMFKRGGRHGETVSEAGKLLSYILNKGPLVGIYTILQVDNLANLNQLCDGALSMFTHRVALQMDEHESQKIVDTDIASRLYVMNRPSSKYRAYYYNSRKRTTVKFKPYK